MSTASGPCTGATVGSGTEWRPAIIVHTSSGQLRFESRTVHTTETAAYMSAHRAAEVAGRNLVAVLSGMGYTL